ncbi:MAG: acyl-CoA dehydratase activase [Anaerovoracaceae bacterium]|jgi:predicted CoA-substrate-specific enzyme activase
MKLGYLCKYVPVELLESMGAEMVMMAPRVTDLSRADAAMHPNMCSFIKSALVDFEDGDYDGIVLTNCCDSTRRLHDRIGEDYPDKFVYMLDVPRKVSAESVRLFAENIRKLEEAYSAASGSEFDEKDLRERLRRSVEAEEKKNEPESGRINIAVMGARLGESMRDMLGEYNVNIVDDMTCSQIERRYGVADSEDIFEGYARALLTQLQCMRMIDISRRLSQYKADVHKADGILYNTMKFCDMYSYEYAYLNSRKDLPILKIETDGTDQSAGQIRTRLEAFFESLAASKNMQPETIKKEKNIDTADSAEAGADRGKTEDMFGFSKKKKNTDGKETTGRTGGTAGNSSSKGAGPLRVVGIDSGSTTTNAVVMDENKKILSSVVIRTGSRSYDSALEAYESVLKKAGIGKGSEDMIVSTGYGRVNLEFANREITEISCHGRGANYFNPRVRTILDIGGQDSKAIRINERGDVLDFAMNDKCAAGTGRFLEAMAATLGVGIDELGPVSLQWKDDIDISSMCTVFAESEVISLIADNKNKADIAHGIHKSIANRATGLMKRVGLEPEFMMTGGVAQNPGAVKAVEEKLGAKLYICEDPEIVGAVGAALYGLDELM